MNTTDTTGGPTVTVRATRPRAVRLAQLHTARMFTALVRVGAFEPISPAPGVYAWAPVQTDPRVRDITAHAAADILSERAS